MDTLHFAAGTRDADGRVQAAVVRRHLMDAWASRLATAGIVAQKMYSEADAVGGMPNTATLLVDVAGGILAEPGGAVTTIDLDESPLAIRHNTDAGFIRRLLRRLVQRHRERATLLGLSRMQPHLLRDVGIEPGDIFDALDGKRSSVLFNPMRKPDHR